MSNYEFTDDGYVDDGYFFTGRPIIFQSGANRVELRGPSKRSGRVQLLQAEEYSSGWARYGYAPLAVVHTLTLEYQQLRSDEVDQLKAFQTAVDFSAGTFDYIDGASGLTVPAWFAEPGQATEEISYNKYGATIELHSLMPFFTLPAAPANIDAILNAAHYPCTVSITRKQPQVWMSDGTHRVSNKSAITRQLHTLALVRLAADQLAALIAHFIGQGGMRDRWTWTVAPAVLILEGTTNLIIYSDPSALAHIPNKSGISITSGVGPALSAGIYFAQDGLEKYAYFEPATINGQTYTLSAYVLMDGGQAPGPGGFGSIYDFSFLMQGAVQTAYIVELISGSLYRVSATRTVTAAGGNFGLFHNPAHRNRGFKISGFQLEAKPSATPYVATSGAAVTRPDSYSPAVTHTCRHANTAIEWQQSPVRTDRYDLSVTLEEDL